MKYTEELENKIRINPSPPEQTKLYTKVDLLLQSVFLFFFTKDDYYLGMHI
jgi:hypothetical protein